MTTPAAYTANALRARLRRQELELAHLRRRIAELEHVERVAVDLAVRLATMGAVVAHDDVARILRDAVAEKYTNRRGTPNERHT